MSVSYTTSLLPNNKKDYFSRCSAFLLGFALPISIVLLNVSYILLLITIILCHHFGHIKQLVKQPIFYLAFFMFLLMASSLLFYSDSDGIRQGILFKYRKLLYLLPLGLFFLQDKKLGIFTFIGFMTANTVVLLLSILAWGGFLQSFNISASNPTVFHLQITQNFFMAISGLVWLYLAIYSHGAKRFGYLFLFIANAANILLMVQGRTGYLALFIGIITLSCLALTLKQRCIAGVIIALFLMLFVIVPNRASDRLLLGINEIKQCAEVLETDQLASQACSTSMGLRSEFVYYASKKIMTAPWFGHGVGSFNYYGENYNNDSLFHHVNAHNEYIMQLLQTGIIGLGLFLAWFAAGYRAAFNLTKPTKTLAVVILTLYLACCTVNSFILDSYEGQLLMIIMAYLLAAQTHYREHALAYK